MVTPEDAAIELLRRRKARKSLLEFNCYLNPEYIVSDFARQVCSALEQFYADVKAGHRPILILQAPPQHGKSELVSRTLPAWLFGQDPNLRIVAVSYGKDLATDMNRDVQRRMTTQEYKLLFPNSALSFGRSGNEIEARRNSDKFELPKTHGSYVCAGVGGPITGKPSDIGIIDDPTKNAKEALSQTVKDGVWKWYISTFLTRLSKNSGQIIMATSWAKDDLSGRIAEISPRAKVLKFPAINQDGEALVPELHPIEKLLETKSTMSEYFWSAMYQQSPMLVGGNIIKSEYFKYYSVLPQIKYRVIYADTAMKTAERNDYSVFECWGMGVDGKIYLIDMIRGKWEAPELERRAIAFWNKHKAIQGPAHGQLRQLKIEDKSSGTGLIQKIRSQAQIPVQGIEREKDKFTRVMDSLGYIESGYVMLPEDAPFTNDFIAENEAFSGDGSHLHDDQIDPMLDAITDMLAGNKLHLWERIA